MRQNTTLQVTAACMLPATPVFAAPIYELTITGTVSQVDAIPELQPDFGDTFSVGDPFTFVMTYDGGAPATVSGGNFDEYDGAITGFTGSIAAYNFVVPGDASTEIRLVNGSNVNAVNGDHFAIRILAADDNNPLGPNVSTAVPVALGLTLTDTSDGVFPGAGAPPPLSTDFDFSRFDAVATSFFEFFDPVTDDDVKFNVTGLSSRLIPEPASALLLALCGLALLEIRCRC